MDKKRIIMPVGYSVKFVERHPPTSCLLGLVQDHCYTNVVWCPDNYNKDICKFNNRIGTHLHNEYQIENSKGANDQISFPRTLISCDNHPDMFELKHEKLVKVGDKFSSPREFMVYLNRHAKEWLYYYQIYTSHRKRCEDLVVRCVFSKRTSSASAYKPRGLRKRKFVADCNCPCRIVMVRPRGHEHYIVTRVCNHHSHELTEEAYLRLSHARGLLPEIKEEIDDLLSIGASTGTVRRYLQSVTGFTFAYNFFNNRKRILQKHNIEKQFSIKKLKELTEKIKMFGEEPPTGDAEGKTDQKQIVNREEESRIFSTLAAEEKPAGKQSDTKRIIRKMKSEGTQLVELIQNLPKNRSSLAPKQDSHKTRKTDNNVDGFKRKRSKRSKKAEDEVTNKRSRLETTLDNLSYDQELLESVRLLQEGYTNSTQPLNDSTSLKPAATISHEVTTPNSALLQQEHDTNDRDLDQDIFSADYNYHESNDIHYDINTYPQSEVIDENVEDKETDNDVKLEKEGNENDNNNDISDRGDYGIEDNSVHNNTCPQSEVFDENVVYYEDLETFNYMGLHNEGNGNDCTANGIESNSVYSTDVVYNSQSENVYSNSLNDIPYVDEKSEVNALNQGIRQGYTGRGRLNNNKQSTSENINNTNQTKIKSKVQIIDVKHSAAQTDCTIIINDSFKNTKKLKLKQKGTQTNDEFPNSDELTLDELLNNEIFQKSRTIIKNLELHDNSIVYINKYNIDKYIMQEVLHKHFQKMADIMSISIFNLFCDIYSGKAAIKMNVKNTGTDMTIIMTYVTKNIPPATYKHSENIINRYKYELNYLYHALMTARDKIDTAEVKVNCSKCKTNDVENLVPIYRVPTKVFKNIRNNNNFKGNHQQSTEFIDNTNEEELDEKILKSDGIKDATIDFLKLTSTSSLETQKLGKAKELFLKQSRQRSAKVIKKTEHNINDKLIKNNNEVNVTYNLGIQPIKGKKQQSILNRILTDQQNTKLLKNIYNKKRSKNDKSLEINCQNTVSALKVQIRELQRENKHLALIIDELSEKSSTLTQKGLQTDKSYSQYIPINESQVQKKKSLNLYLQDLTFKNLIIIRSLNDKVTALQDADDSRLATKRV